MFMIILFIIAPKWKHCKYPLSVNTILLKSLGPCVCVVSLLWADYIYTQTCMYVYVSIYIKTEREREERHDSIEAPSAIILPTDMLGA